jgi:hypothetical protein
LAVVYAKGDANVNGQQKGNTIPNIMQLRIVIFYIFVDIMN